MALNIVVQYYADLSLNANFRQSFRRFWRWMPDRVGHDEERWPVGACSICRNDAGRGNSISVWPIVVMIVFGLWGVIYGTYKLKYRDQK